MTYNMKNRGGRREAKEKRSFFFHLLLIYSGKSKIGVFQNSEICVFWQILTRKSCIIIWNLVLFLIHDGCSSFRNPLKFKEWKGNFSWNKQYLNHLVYVPHFYYFVHYNLRELYSFFCILTEQKPILEQLTA